MKIAETSIEKIRNEIDIVQVIGSYVTLKKKGRNHTGLCPFHSEKTPSFSVSSEKKFWYCFGCHEGGDVIRFVSKIDQLSFQETILHLSQEYHIPIEVSESETGNSDYELSVSVKDALQVFRETCKKELKESDENMAYLLNRGFVAESIDRFHLGFCPNDLDVVSLLKAKGFSDRVIESSGLVIKSQQGYWFSKFKNRIIFPILDISGRTVGFSGRIRSGNGAKYINSEDSIVFRKRNLLYNLDLAKTAVKSEKSLIVTEGYADVIMAFQNGIQNIVASMGTAVTREQVRHIKRLTTKVYLAFDQDEAGLNATEAAYKILRAQNIQVYFISHGQKDIADLIQSENKEALETAIKTAKPVLDFMIDRVINRHNTNDIQEVALAVDKIVPLLKNEKNDIVMDHYLTKISEKLNVKKEVVFNKVYSQNVSFKSFVQEMPQKSKYQKAEEWLLIMSISNLDIRKAVNEELTEADFLSENGKQIWSQLKNSDKVNHSFLELISDEKIKKVASELFINQDHISQDKQELSVYMSLIKANKINKEKNELMEKLKHFERIGDEESSNEILTALSKLGE